MPGFKQLKIPGELRSSNSNLRSMFIRLAVEERLRLMWDQITEEMTTLAQDKTQEAVVREELLNWMGQVPNVLQDIFPKLSGKIISCFGSITYHLVP